MADSSTARAISGRDYRDPHTGIGFDLAPMSSSGASSFLVHEVGKRNYENWNHRGIVSPYWRLHHNTEPGNLVRFGDEQFALSRERAVLTPAGTPIDTIGRRTVPHLWIHYTPLQEFVIVLRHPVAVPLSAAALECLQEIRLCLPEAAVDAPIPGTEQALRVYHLCKAVLHLVFAGLPASVFQVIPPRLYQVLDHIDGNLGGDLKTGTLARLAGRSPNRLSSWFKEHVGVTPNAYVKSARLRAAVKALTLTGKSIDEIAGELGFPNRYYFSRVFARSFGCGPASFRKGRR